MTFLQHQQIVMIFTHALHPLLFEIPSFFMDNNPFNLLLKPVFYTMLIIRPAHIFRSLLTAICLTLLLAPYIARGEEEMEDTSALFSAWREQSSTASRAPKPLSQTAENVTVVTADEIDALNAHTLADVLDTIPGIQLSHNGGPGITTYTFIQSSEFTQILVFVDGISITNLTGNYSEINLIPARIIERIEIVKGAASSFWGQALGGVINVITKSPEKGRTIGGSADASIGERTTADAGAELSGTNGRMGYYLSGGYLGSNGLLPGTEIDSSHAHAKLTYDLPDHGQIFALFDYNRTNLGDLYVPDYDLKEKTNQSLLMALIGLRQPLGKQMELEVTGRHSFLNSAISWFNISNGAPWSWQPDLPTGITKQSVTGASAKLVWRGDNHLLVTGGDYDHVELDANTPDNTIPKSRSAGFWNGGTYT